MVMAGLVPAIHVFAVLTKFVDALGPAYAKPSFASAKAGKSGHDEVWWKRPTP